MQKVTYMSYKKGSRKALFIFYHPVSEEKRPKESTEKIIGIAKKHNLSFAHIYVFILCKYQAPFACSNIIGATNPAQLKENLESLSVQLNTEALKEIEEVTHDMPFR